MDNIKQKRQPFNGYYRAAKGTENAELTHTGPGTPAGEYFRRFWQPVAMTEQVGEFPVALEILGEELVLFRDLAGQLGLLHKYCSHRRASLEYGIVSEKGIRCCYHGWLYDVDGAILEVPGEPANNADGVIPTLAGDVIIAIPQAQDDVALQQEAGKIVGDIVRDTLLLSWDERPVEIEKRVREWAATKGAFKAQ